jgi:hypothetical protein
MKQKTLYIAGPMRGYPRFNFAAFADACVRLRGLYGYKVISPHEIDLAWGFNPDKSLEAQGVKMLDMIRRDVEAISMCDMVVTLPGWKKSIGARAETTIAKWLKKPIRPLSSFK